MIKKLFKDKGLSDALSLTIFVMVESLQLLVIVAFIYSFIPVPPPDFVKDLPLRIQKGIQPKREIFFYHWFLFVAIALQIAFASFFRWQKMDIPRRELNKIALVDGCLVLIEFFAVFKIWQYDNPWWARDLMFGSIGTWMLLRIFWVECQQGFKIISEVMMEKSKIIKWCIDGFILVLLIVCLWVPDAQRALGRVFVWDQFHSWDPLIMLPGWGYIHGEGLNTDIMSSWGMGAVIFISRCSQILGGFDYAHVLTVLMMMVIIYYGLLYAFLRVWLRSVLLAVAVLAIAIKVQMFHTGISPLIWVYPQDTPVRHWLDLIVLGCLWQHARSFQGKYLGWAALCIGVSLAWVLSTGLCLLAAFWGYLIFLSMTGEYRSQMFTGFRDLRRILFYSLLPLVVMGFTLFLLAGTVVFHPVFWRNIFEPIRLFLQGVGIMSFYACLYDRHFFAFIASFVIPVIYAWTLIIVASVAVSKKSPREDLFLIPLCIYGLTLYTHYLAHASISHYYAVGIPVVMVIGFWLTKIMGWFPQAKRSTILILLAIGAWGALFTNIFFIYYPNTFDISRMDWQTEVNFYQSNFKFDQDAAMIDRLIPESKGAPIISSFETQILIQAQRKTFFYYAPLVTSARMDTNSFNGTSLITPERLTRTTNQITEQSPEYIFVERKLLGQWPQEYVQYYPGIILVLRYVTQHYVPQEQGTYLIAMHKKD